MAMDSKKKYRLLKENIVETLEDVEMGKVLSGRTPNPQWTKAELDKWDYVTLCHKASQQWEQSTQQRDNLKNERKDSQITHVARGRHAEYVRNLNTWQQNLR